MLIGPSIAFGSDATLRSPESRRRRARKSCSAHFGFEVIEAKTRRSQKSSADRPRRPLPRPAALGSDEVQFIGSAARAPDFCPSLVGACIHACMDGRAQGGHCWPHESAPPSRSSSEATRSRGSFTGAISMTGQRPLGCPAKVNQKT
jgi:hypothetical protein